MTIEDLADRWDTPQSARTNGPAELGFRDGENGFNAKKSAYASMKLYQVVRAAKDLVQGAPNSPSASGVATGRGMPLTEVLCERAQLEKEHMTKWNVPKLPKHACRPHRSFINHYHLHHGTVAQKMEYVELPPKARQLVRSYLDPKTADRLSCTTWLEDPVSMALPLDQKLGLEIELSSG